MGRKQVPCREVDSSSAPFALPRPAHSMLTTATQPWTGRAKHWSRMHSAPISRISAAWSDWANRPISGWAKRARSSPMAAEPIMAVQAENW